MRKKRLLFDYFWKYQRSIIIGTFCSIANQVFDLCPELLMGIAIDLVVYQEKGFLAHLGFVHINSQLIFLGIVCLATWTLETIFQYFYLTQWRTIAQKIQVSLRTDAYKHIQTFDLSYFETRNTGELLSLLHEDVNQLERFFESGINTIIQLTTSTIMTACIFFYTSPILTFYTLIPTPFICLITWVFQNKLSELHKEVRKQAAILSNRLTNNILGIITIKSYTAEEKEVRTIARASINYMRANKQLTYAFAAFRPIVRLSVVIGFLITIILGGWYAIQGIIPIGAYGSLIFLTQRLLWPFTEIAELVNDYKRATTSFERIADLLKTESTIKDGPQIIAREEILGNIEYKNISFSYPNGTSIFKNFSCTIKAKQTTAFVGPTGSGKSSLIKLILRFYAPQEGTILLDGHEISTLTLKNLRNHISFISQDPFLFYGSVYDNIAYGLETMPEQSAIENAARAAQADSFIEKLTQKYASCVGERGNKFSGGQRQRIAIARAIMKNSPIFIFDEATSAIDTETEAALHQSLIDIGKEHTTIIIAHRLSTIRHADIIYVLNHGTIIESGTHDQLIARNTMYSRLWQLQTGIL
jgi:ATP-binding cassette subfamily B protein